MAGEGTLFALIHNSAQYVDNSVCFAFGCRFPGFSCRRPCERVSICISNVLEKAYFYIFSPLIMVLSIRIK
ncbi:predicted protein [Arabidopsis lyrata subsp. lyrata]|uniref:Predicted protein n=1 Tax=Arabidopsis lyrata subsp. lyrata TaxID=81972 RepID=D7LKF5_ARALL|nr:predicted protein [Arabidopsis lyrata subsp. lyrata]